VKSGSSWTAHVTKSPTCINNTHLKLLPLCDLAVNQNLPDRELSINFGFTQDDTELLIERILDQITDLHN